MNKDCKSFVSRLGSGNVSLCSYNRTSSFTNLKVPGNKNYSLRDMDRKNHSFRPEVRGFRPLIVEMLKHGFQIIENVRPTNREDIRVFKTAIQTRITYLNQKVSQENSDFVESEAKYVMDVVRSMRHISAEMKWLLTMYTREIYFGAVSNTDKRPKRRRQQRSTDNGRNVRYHKRSTDLGDVAGIISNTGILPVSDSAHLMQTARVYYRNVKWAPEGVAVTISDFKELPNMVNALKDVRVELTLKMGDNMNRDDLGDLEQVLRGLTKLWSLKILGEEDPEYGTESNDDTVANLPKYLTVLKLINCRITNIGMQSISNLSKLTTLHIMGDGWELVSDDGFIHLLELKQLRALKIETAESKVGDRSLAHIGQMSSLTDLDIWGFSNITNDGLSQLRPLVKLRHLGLMHCSNISDEGFEYLTNLNIESLDIQSIDVGEVALQHVSNLPLKTLRMSDIYVDRDIIQRLEPLSMLDALFIQGIETEQYTTLLRDLAELQLPIRVLDISYINAGSIIKDRTDIEHLSSMQSLETLGMMEIKPYMTFSEQELKAFAQNMPPKLKELYIYEDLRGYFDPAIILSEKEWRRYQPTPFMFRQVWYTNYLM